MKRPFCGEDPDKDIWSVVHGAFWAIVTAAVIFFLLLTSGVLS